jgi:FkbM family methyltransferase
LKEKYASDTNIHVVNKAVGSISERQTFHVDQNDEINSLLPRLESRRRYGRPKDEIRVQAITIDDFTNVTALDHVDILKLDIEGGEMDALRGGNCTLSEQRIDLIYLEVGFYRRYQGEKLFREIDGYLDQFGYSLYNLYNLYQIPDNDQLSICDAIYVSQEVRDEIDARLNLIA